MQPENKPFVKFEALQKHPIVVGIIKILTFIALIVGIMAGISQVTGLTIFPRNGTNLSGNHSDSLGTPGLNPTLTTVYITPTVTPTPTTAPTPVTTLYYTEVAGPDGGKIFSDYQNAGGIVGQVDASHPVNVICRLTGWTYTSDGNDWWYYLYNSSFYVFADNFYNIPGVTSGSLKNTPHYDSRVPLC